MFSKKTALDGSGKKPQYSGAVRGGGGGARYVFHLGQLGFRIIFKEVIIFKEGLSNNFKEIKLRRSMSLSLEPDYRPTEAASDRPGPFEAEGRLGPRDPRVGLMLNTPQPWCVCVCGQPAVTVLSRLGQIEIAHLNRGILTSQALNCLSCGGPKRKNGVLSDGPHQKWSALQLPELPEGTRY